jgi:hypothetical protein
MSMRFMTSVLTSVCFCAWLETAPAQVPAQATSVVTPQQAGECRAVEKKGNGRSETASCISVFVTVPPSLTPAPPVDACKVGGFHFLSWSWLKCNSGAVSAVASLASAIIAFVIGFLVFLLNRNIRKGQVAHEQMRMLLEIDGELVDRPELWAVHGTTYLSAPFPSKEFDTSVEAFRKASPADKPAAAQAVADALCANPNATEIVKLRQLAFTTRYLNFFEILFANYGKKTFWRRHPEKNEEWKAWRAYIVDFFKDNKYAQDEWKKFAQKHIYSESFEKFMAEIVR